MELDQKCNFLIKNSKNVADPPDEDFPNTVLLFEPRMSHPALRVISENFVKILIDHNSSHMLPIVSKFCMRLRHA